MGGVLLQATTIGVFHPVVAAGAPHWRYFGSSHIRTPGASSKTSTNTMAITWETINVRGGLIDSPLIKRRLAGEKCRYSIMAVGEQVYPPDLQISASKPRPDEMQGRLTGLQKSPRPSLKDLKRLTGP